MRNDTKIMSYRRVAGRGILLAVLACVPILTVGAGMAQANVAYVERGSFGEPGSGGGQFNAPNGVAVDPSNGDVYVVDAGHARVQKLGSKGEFILMFGKKVNSNGESVCRSGELCNVGVAGFEEGLLGEKLEFGFFSAGAEGVAVDPETHDVYVADTVNRRIEKFSSEGAYLATITGAGTPAGEFSERGSGNAGVRGVAVDPLEDTENGGHDLYVADYGNNVVDVFSSDGTYLRELSVEAPDAVAFDPTGNAYVVNREEREAVYKFPNGKGAAVRLPLEGGLKQAEAIAVDSSGDLLVLEHEGGGHTHVAVFAPSGTRLTQFGEGEVAETLAFGGVAVNSTTSEAYFSGGGSEGAPEYDKVRIFEPQVETPPTAETGAASGVTGTSTTLTGTVNPEGQTSEFWFKYGLTEAYGNETTHASAGSGMFTEAVTAHAEGLQPHATYHYRLFVRSAAGTTEAIGAKELTTLSEAPTISDGSAGSLMHTEATLEARVNPNNEETYWLFEYATEAALLGTPSAMMVPGTSPLAALYGNMPISQSVGGLQANTVYYWRTVASNAGGGTRQGTIEEFRTQPPPPIVVSGEATSITDEAATIMGTVNPGSEGPNSETQYYFEYSTNETQPGSLFACSGECVRIPSPAQRAGEPEGGERTAAETVGLTGLQPNTVYHYRIVASNDHGAHFANGLDRTFATLPQPPAAITDPPIAVFTSTAILSGEVVPQCVEGRYPPTAYRFEYGTTTAYGAGSEAAAITASGCAIGGEAVTASLAGLLPDTVYHYRLNATNDGGETQGKDLTFTTNAASQPASGPLPAGFSLTGPPLAGPAPFVFPTLSTLSPLPPPPVKTTTTPKALTKAQELAKALEVCKKQPKRRRAGCDRRAGRAYGPPAKPTGKGKKGR